jgi:2-polyprenyl-3-methyl-5-hydroxy-6-metoxy-1,4-benzoquinol methylase
MQTHIFSPENKPSGYYVNSRIEMLKFIPPGVARVLEVGCGEGAFGSCLKRDIKAEVWGVDICKKAAEEAKGKLDKVIVGDVENDQLDLPDDYFDCIVFNDVLEHMKYPWIFLKKIKESLKNKGYIVASIPNVRYFYNIKDLLKYKEWKYVDEGILDKTHLRFFTIKSIKDMLISCDYKILMIEGINAVRFPWKFRIFNWILFKNCDDMKFLRFACVAQKQLSV